MGNGETLEALEKEKYMDSLDLRKISPSITWRTDQREPIPGVWEV
jgi:hypothetical protein